MIDDKLMAWLDTLAQKAQDGMKRAREIEHQNRQFFGVPADFAPPCPCEACTHDRVTLRRIRRELANPRAR